MEGTTWNDPNRDYFNEKYQAAREAYWRGQRERATDKRMADTRGSEHRSVRENGHDEPNQRFRDSRTSRAPKGAKDPNLQPWQHQQGSRTLADSRERNPNFDHQNVHEGCAVGPLQPRQGPDHSPRGSPEDELRPGALTQGTLAADQIQLEIDNEHDEDGVSEEEEEEVNPFLIP